MNTDNVVPSITGRGATPLAISKVIKALAAMDQSDRVVDCWTNGQQNRQYLVVTLKSLIVTAPKVFGCSTQVIPLSQLVGLGVTRNHTGSMATVSLVGVDGNQRKILDFCFFFGNQSTSAHLLERQHGYAQSAEQVITRSVKELGGLARAEATMDLSPQRKLQAAQCFVASNRAWRIYGEVSKIDVGLPLLRSDPKVSNIANELSSAPNLREAIRTAAGAVCSLIDTGAITFDEIRRIMDVPFRETATPDNGIGLAAVGQVDGWLAGNMERNGAIPEEFLPLMYTWFIVLFQRLHSIGRMPNV
jgi:hypothetical protein